MTEKIYQKDSYLKEIKAKIIKNEKSENLWKILPDKTIVYPEGGGQPSDIGFINGIKIIKTEIDGDKIFHYIEKDISEEEIIITIDFEKRYDNMQQHTAQHLLSEVLVKLYGYQTLSFSIGDNHSSIEINTKNFPFEKIVETEKECLDLIIKNLPIKVYETEDISKIPLRKPPKIKGKIRIIEIDGFDYSACGGTHVKSTGEISLIKIIKTDKVRSNIRLYYVAGYRALKDYQKKNEIILNIQREIGRPQEEFNEAIKDMKGKIENMRKKLNFYKKRELEEEIERILKSSEEFIFKIFEDEEIKDIKFMAKKLVDNGKNILFLTKEPSKYILIGRGKGTLNLRKISSEIFSIVKGRGGGREDWIEGKIEDFSGIGKLKDFLSESFDKA